MKSMFAFLVLLGVGGYSYVTWQPQPKAHRYSADDVFYLRQYVSVRTKHGIVGFLPGQELSLSANSPVVPGKVMVTDGQTILAVDRDALTHDIDEADALQASDSQSQSTLLAGMLQTKQSADVQDQAAAAFTANGINASNALQVSQNTVGTYRTRLNGDPQPYWQSYGGSGSGPVFVSGRAPGTAAAAGAVLGSVNASLGSVTPTSSYHPPAGAVSSLPARSIYNASSTHLNATGSQQ